MTNKLIPNKYDSAMSKLTKAENGVDKARALHARTSNPVAKFATGLLVSHRQRVMADSDEHAGMVGALKRLDEGHALPFDKSADAAVGETPAPATERPDEVELPTEQ